MIKRFAVVLAMVALAVLLVAAPAKAQQGSQRYLIGSNAPLTSDQVAALQDAGANILYIYHNFGGAAATIASSRVAQVEALPFVTSVNEDPLKQLSDIRTGLTAQETQPLPGTPYWQDLINLESAPAEYDGAGVWVAVLDSGFYPNWRDYFDEGQILTDKARAFNAANGNPNANQWDVGSDPHAMAVSGTIVGYKLIDDTNEGGWGEGYATGAAGTYQVPGVASGAQIIPVKVCEPIGCFGSAINAGVDYITTLKEQNPDQPIVINESLGGPSLDPVEKAAIDAALQAGVVMVASAGNAGEAGMGYPGAYEPVISVGAGGWTDQWNEYPDKTWWLDDVPETGVDPVFVANFSSRALTDEGQTLDVVSTGRFLLLPYPCAQLYKDGQVSAGTANRTCASKATPDNMQSVNFQYLFMSGTSFSSPTIAGVVARMLDKDPTLDNSDASFGVISDPTTWGPGSLETLLENSATPLPDTGSVDVTYRTGVTVTNAWDTSCGDDGLLCDAVGHGWVFADDAVNMVP